MLVVKDLIAEEKDGSLSFGNFSLAEKSKKSDFEYKGDLYKVKTFNEITRLEKNGAFVYESVPGTSVFNLVNNDDGVTFGVSGDGDAQITLEFEAEKDYEVFVNEESLGIMKTNLGGKLIFSVELETDNVKNVRVIGR